MIVRRVVGESMIPALKPNCVVFAINTQKIHIGDVLVATLDGREVVKRVERIVGGKYFLVGDNRQVSSDSRSKGTVNRSDVIGRVIWPRTNR